MFWILCVPLVGASLSLVRSEEDAESEAAAGPLVQITWIRHGLSCANMNGLAKGRAWAANKLCNFRLKDPPLANHAVHVSAELSVILRSREQYDFYGASHLRRAQQTAALMFAEDRAKATAGQPVYVLPYIGEDLPGADNVADLSDVHNATNPARTRTFGFERAEAFAEFKRPSYHIPSVDFKFFSASSAPTASTSVLQSSAGAGGSASLAQIEAGAVEVADDSLTSSLDLHVDRRNHEGSPKNLGKPDMPTDIPGSEGTPRPHAMDVHMENFGFKKTDYETPHMGNALDFIAQNVVPFVKKSFPGRKFDQGTTPMKLAIVTHSKFMAKNLKNCFAIAKGKTRKPCNNEAVTVTYRRHVEDGKWRLTPDFSKGWSYPLGECGKPIMADGRQFSQVLWREKDYSFCEGAYANCPAEYADEKCHFRDATRDLGLGPNDSCPALGEKGVPKI